MQKINASCGTQHGRGRAQRRRKNRLRRTQEDAGVGASTASLALHLERNVLCRADGAREYGGEHRAGAESRAGRCQRGGAGRAWRERVRGAFQSGPEHQTAGNTTIQSAARRTADSVAGVMAAR